MKKTILFILVWALGMVVGVAKADFTFGELTEVPNVNSSSHEQNASISADDLSLFFISTRPGGLGGTDIWATTRETTDEDWGAPVNLGPTVNTPVGDGGVSISSDGLSLYFSSTRSRGSNGDLWVTTRETINSEWGAPMNLGPTVNSSADQSYPSISANGLELYFTSNRGGGHGAYDLWVTTRTTVDDDWSTPVNLGPTVNSSAYEVDPGISADGCVLFFASDRSGGYGSDDIWMTIRATTDDPWGEPVNLGPIINSSGWEDYPNVSADGSTLFFTPSSSDRWNSGDIWQAPIIPIVDFNSDGFIDTGDLLIMIDNWGTDDSLCDIGPMPWGDGIVDREDVEILMSYWGQEIPDPALLAYWKLNETEGDIAYDSVGENDGRLYGEPTWQPDGGIIDGALQLNGVDDYVSTPFVLNPADGSFSVFAWIKGGAPGQVILSQDGSADWLSTDALEDTLVTYLSRPTEGRNPAPIPPLVTETEVTDGDWHRVGLVWDDSERILYVDGVEAARDLQGRLEESHTGLSIGTGKDLAAGAFWSGLIDDVRIYNRAIVPTH